MLGAAGGAHPEDVMYADKHIVHSHEARLRKAPHHGRLTADLAAEVVKIHILDGRLNDAQSLDELLVDAAAWPADARFADAVDRGDLAASTGIHDALDGAALCDLIDDRIVRIFEDPQARDGAGVGERRREAYENTTLILGGSLHDAGLERLADAGHLGALRKSFLCDDAAHGITAAPYHGRKSGRAVLQRSRVALPS